MRSFRLEFTTESTDEIQATIEAYQLAIQTNQINHAWLSAYKENQDYTKGHYQRGVI